jgi:uncharacterized protein YecT (DUF1311 family)
MSWPQARAPELDGGCNDSRLLSECLADAFLAADAELNKTYQAVLKAMTTKGARGRVREAQRAWIAFRDKECDVQVGPDDGGSLHGAQLSSCLARLTRQRSEQLAYILNCEEEPCPPKQ